MKQSIYSACFTALLALSTVVPASVNAEESGYFISENLYTYMHRGPGKQFRILGSVNSSSPVVLLNTSEDGEFVQIRDGKDREGWIEAEHISKGESRSQRIDSLTEQLSQVRSQLTTEQQEVSRLNDVIANLQEQSSTHQGTLVEVQKERDVLQQRLSNYTDEIEMQWFVNGGVVAGGGVLLGLILSFLPRRKKRQDNWM
ncbi:TIGR04211 family SH3 domain-containing protein [Echinimonas agarilytica]|uniref:TIGR04211 family SH3 domain-containing protein n=1 Tax=Echinimonas agarilytica TaxID=1215918 RepID=A0AA41W747_9GAMM|nr:TIGR04211 family SH3 domain-containing protein [Echinimonas agarilytica]MCM2680382.1 TIGR04211 family SH3 domain-containing protein [Echinimonas agarilytica]